MSKFSPSDKVVFIGDEFDIFSKLTPFKMYTVENIYSNGNFIDLVNDKNQLSRYKSEFFVTIPEFRAMKISKIKKKNG